MSRKVRMAECCNKKHFARGLCKSCYWKNYWNTHPPRVRKNKSVSDRKYYLKNRRRLISRQLEYYAENKAAVIKRAVEYNKSHPEKHNEAASRYQKKNRSKYNAYFQKRRTAKTLAGGSFTAAEWSALCNKYHHKCLCCDKRRKLTADHIIPVSKGGTSDISNIQPLCQPCNSSKGTKTTDFR